MPSASPAFAFATANRVRRLSPESLLAPLSGVLMGFSCMLTACGHCWGFLFQLPPRNLDESPWHRCPSPAPMGKTIGRTSYLSIPNIGPFLKPRVLPADSD